MPHYHTECSSLREKEGSALTFKTRFFPQKAFGLTTTRYSVDCGMECTHDDLSPIQAFKGL